MAPSPRLAARVLRIFLSREDAEVVIGDLDELFHIDRVPRDGVRAARRWYWRQAASVITATLFGRRAHQPRARHAKGSVMAAIGQDLSYALRGLRQQPAFTATAVLTLALGIGVNIAIFSIAHAVLFKPLPFADPDRLMMVELRAPDREAPGTYRSVSWSYPKYQALRAQQTAFESAGIFTPWTWNITGTDEAERLAGELVDSTYFGTLGIAPQVGRVFTADETRAPGSAPLAILSHGLWSRRFGGDPGAIGRTIGLGAIPHTIVGVLPPGFRGLTGQAEVWVPVMSTKAASELGSPQSHSYFLIARRKAGVSADEAAAEVKVIGARIDAQYPSTFEKGAWVARALPLDGQRVDPLFRRSVLLLLAAVAAVLLIACVNLANLTLVRALARQRDVAIRLALGASRIRIVRQLMAESVLIAAAGAVCGLAVAYGAIIGTAALMPDVRAAGPGAVVLRGETAGLTRVGLGMLGFDSGTALFTLAITAGSALLFGLIPAWRTSRRDVTMTMKAGAPGAIASGGRGFSPRNLLIAGEMALALVLLVAAGLMLKSVGRLQATELGFNPEGLLTVRIAFPGAQYPPQKGADAIHALLERLGQRGEIESVAYGFCAPVSGGCNATTAERKDHPPADGAEPIVGVHWASARYFETLGVRLVRGRLFTEQDRAGQPKVLLVNEVAARRIWGDEDPVGKRVTVGQGGYHPDGGEVVGVVSNVRYGAVETSIGPDVYLPLLQSPRGNGLIFVRSRAPARALVPVISQEIQAIDADVPLVDVKTMEGRFGDAIWRTRLSALLLGAFSTLALILAAVGMYGVMSQAIAQRTREIGLRMALGAGRGDILRMIVGRASLIGVAGTLIGIALAIPSSRLLASLLFEVEPGDPMVLGGLASVLLAVALLASYLPARRATRVDPLTTLRAE